MHNQLITQVSNIILETERLILRRFEDSDAEAVYKFNSHLEIMKYSPMEGSGFKILMNLFLTHGHTLNMQDTQNQNSLLFQLNKKLP